MRGRGNDDAVAGKLSFGVVVSDLSIHEWDWGVTLALTRGGDGGMLVV